MTNATTQKTSAGTKPSTHFDYSHFNTRSVESATYDCNGNRLPYAITAMKEEWELITPETATLFLDTMNRNRSIKARAVARYKSDLENGKFNICFDSPIIFNRNGEMVNGQHRCEAIKESGVPCWCKVYRGVPNEAVIDKGMLRSPGDALWMRGVIGDNMRSPKIIALVKSYFRAKGGVDVASITDSQIGEFLNKYGDEVLEAYRISRLGKTGQRVADKSGVQAALFAAIMCGVDKDMLARMMAVVNTGFQSGPDESAAIVLRNRLLNYASTGGLEIAEVCATTEQAISDFINHNPRTRRYRNPKHIYIDKCIASL